jgi:hypothetical protein
MFPHVTDTKQALGFNSKSDIIPSLEEVPVMLEELQMTSMYEVQMELIRMLKCLAEERGKNIFTKQKLLNQVQFC